MNLLQLIRKNFRPIAAPAVVVPIVALPVAAVAQPSPQDFDELVRPGRQVPEPKKEEPKSAVCEIEYRGSWSTEGEGRNHPRLAVELFKRPAFYQPPDNLAQKLFQGVAERIPVAEGQLVQTKDDVAYLQVLAGWVRDNVLNLDQRNPQSQRMANRYLGHLTRAIEERPILAKFFRECGGAPATGYPSRNGGYDDCLGYEAFVASVENFTGASLTDVRKVSPLVDSLATEHGQCITDFGETASYSAETERKLRHWIGKHRKHFIGVACGEAGDPSELEGKAMLDGLQSYFATHRQGETITRFASPDEDKAYVRTQTDKVYEMTFFDHDSVKEGGTICKMSSLPKLIEEVTGKELGYVSRLLDRTGIDVVAKVK